MHSAEVLFDAVAATTGDHALLHHMRALVAAGLGQEERARHLLEAVIKLTPNDAVAHANLGSLLLNDHQYAAAAAAFEAALLSQPQHEAALAYSAKAYAELGMFDLAADAYRAAIDRMPDDSRLKADFAALLSDIGDMDGAQDIFTDVLARDPDRADLHTTYAVSLFASGDWSAAWREYEWRWRDPRYEHHQPNTPSPRWQGEALRGKTIILQAEQGFGDTIQFLRYVSVLKAQGARVVVQAGMTLHHLLLTTPGIDQVIGLDEPAVGCDFHIPLLSLPGLCGTELDTIPNDIPYVFADAGLAATWCERLGLKPGLAVGLAWQGNPKHPCDRWRSMPLAALHPLLDCPGAQFVSLQFDAGREQPDHGQYGIIDPAARHPIVSFADTAAIIANLDIVITVDSSVAHLAGALGKPVWILLAARNDWRWMRDRDDTPWYPHARLFRQSALHDWHSVVIRVRDALWSWTGAEAGPAPAPPPRPVVEVAVLCDALFMQAARHHRDNNVDRARCGFERILQFAPNHIGALCNLGALERDRGEFARAIELLQRAASLAPDLIEARLALGDTLLRCGRGVDAMLQYQEAQRISPDNADVHAALAIMHRANDEHALALPHFEKAVHIDQRRPARFYLALGQTLIALGRLPGAEISLRHAATLDPTLVEAQTTLRSICSTH
uniref:Tetratricopeptide TPR_2 repeat protein n=1 Tax=Rhodopseudomonas palustris (strain BisA53) TaxID=316055 RepID=Q07N76_RHOP5